jgi:hypothetical protein
MANVTESENKSGKPTGNADGLEKNLKKELPALIAEFLFVLLPLLVVAIVRLSEAVPDKILTAPEWAFGASVLFGLTVVKFVMGFAAREHIFNWQLVGLLTAVLLVFGLVPSLIVLSIILNQPDSSFWLGIAQVLLFVLGAVCFMTLGTLGQMMANTSFQQRIAKMLGLLDKKDPKQGD